MSSSSDHSTRRVLSICDDSTVYDFLQQSLHVSHVAATDSQDETTEFRNTTSASTSAWSFDLANADDWPIAFQKIQDAKKIGLPFGLMFLSVRRDTWDLVRENIEQIWELDESITCVLCLAEDARPCPMSWQLSHPDQWMIFWMPGSPEELFQLASCLTRFSNSPHGASDEPIYSDGDSQVEWGRQDSDNLSIAEQQAELAMARDELATSKVYVNNVVRSMADSLLVIDADMTIGSVNPALMELLGYEEDALVGQSPSLIFGEEFAQGTIIENLLIQGSVSGIESSLLTSEGRLIPISVSGSMMQDEHGQFQGLVCVAQDITERKRMEEEKLQLHEQLLETSRQLGMAEVASDVLHNVGNVLNSINVSIGVVADLLKNSMVGDVGRISQLFQKHRDELGNYFSTNPKGKQIPAYLEKLSGQLIEEQRTAIAELDRLRENAQHAQQCVSSQQDLAKAEGISEPMGVVELLEEALAAHRELIGASQVEVIREFEEIPLLVVDKRQVLEVLVDVIRNACQAMAAVSMKQLVIRAKLIPGPPDSVCLEVEDSGVGIDAEELTKIFGQGYHTKEGERGMSLHSGALIAKNLGGALRAQSNGLGHGATFSLELPGTFYFPDL